VEHRRWRFGIECDDKILTYTGDTEWVDALLAAGRNADLLIAEAYCFERKVRFHLDLRNSARERLPDDRCQAANLEPTCRRNSWGEWANCTTVRQPTMGWKVEIV